MSRSGQRIARTAPRGPTRRRVLAAAGLAAGSVVLAACDAWSFIARTDALRPGGSPFTIEALRARRYPPGEIRLRNVVQRVDAYTSYLMTYKSDGLQLTGVATIPGGSGPFPVVVLNHGFALPARYRSGEGTRSMADALSRRGFITLASDYRGMGGSEDDAAINPGVRLDFAIDVLNLVAAIPSLPEARPAPIGIWGHSLGSDVALRTAEVSDNVGPVAVWAPVSAWMDDIAAYYRIPTSSRSAQLRAALSPGNFLEFLTGPVTIHQGEADRAVRPEWAVRLQAALQAEGVDSELLVYPGLGHLLGLDAQVVVRQTAGFFQTALDA